MGSTIKDTFSPEKKNTETLKESKSSEKSSESKISEESSSPEKIKETKSPIEPKESKEKKEPTEIPKNIIEAKIEQRTSTKEKKEVKLEKKCPKVNNNNSKEEILDDKTSTEQSISGYTSNNREEDNEKTDMNIKIEDNNVNKIQGINDLIFPIITIRKPEENKNSECDSLSALNKALSKSQINFYNMNLKIPDNFPQMNKFSSQLPSEQNSIINPSKNQDSSFAPSYFQNPNPFTKNYPGKKYQRFFHLSHFVPVSFSCSLDTHSVGKYRKNYVQNEKEFFSKIIKISDASNIDEFWEIFQHMKKPSECPVGTDFHVFKKGIVPMWEDNMNKDGGKLSLLLTYKYSNLIWEEVTFDFCKGILPYYVYINGVVISMRQSFVVLSFWVKTKNNHIVEKMRHALTNFLQAPSSNCLDFIPFN